MSNNQYKPRNFRIISHTTRNRILHIEDALAIRQIRFDLWAFARGKGSEGQAEAYVDADEARLLFTDLATGTLPERFQSIGGSQPRGISIPQGQRDGQPCGPDSPQGQALARVITVEEVKANNPIKITIENGQGIPQDNGLITPAWWGDKEAKPDVELAVLLDRRTARQIALAVLAHLSAWAAATYYQRVTENTWQPPREVVVDHDTGEIIE